MSNPKLAAQLADDVCVDDACRKAKLSFTIPPAYVSTEPNASGNHVVLACRYDDFGKGICVWSLHDQKNLARRDSAWGFSGRPAFYSNGLVCHSRVLLCKFMTGS